MKKGKGFSTRAIHSPTEADRFRALTEPVYLTSTYTFDSLDEASATFGGEKDRMVYGRVHNPTQQLLEYQLSDLEGGDSCLVLGSGMAAISALCWTLFSQGDEVVVHNKMYGNSYALFVKELPRFGISAKLADFTDLDKVADSLSKKTKAVFFEVPSNPLLEVIDIRSIKKLLGSRGIALIVDSTLASPAILQPIKHGATYVVQSLTKYINGHGDLIGGAIIGSQDAIREVRMRGLRYLTGATLSPLSCYLTLRGLKTLSLRMDKHSENAHHVAKFLEQHRGVARVFYPGLTSHPQHAVAKELMSMPGGLVSMEIAGGFDLAKTFVDRLKLCKHAVSLGDAVTLVQHPASMTHSHYSDDHLSQFGINKSLIRISVGLEDLEDIIEDIDQALSFRT